MKKARRGRGEGSVTFNSAKRLYVASVRDQRGENGIVRRRFVYAKRKSDVLEKLRALQNAEPSRRTQRQQRMTVGEFIRDWLEASAKSRIRDGTYRLYKGYVDNKITPDHQLSGLRISELTPGDIRAFYGRLAERGDSASLRRKVHVLLKSALKQALKDGELTRNVCDAVDAPRVARREMLCLDEKQSALLLGAVKSSPLRALYVLAQSCGLRLGELLGLQRSDINIAEGRLSVHRTFDEKSLSAKEPKSERSRRTIELPRMAREALSDHEKNTPPGAMNASPWVFCDKEGRPLRGSHIIRDSLTKTLEQAGLPKIRFHDLRHTAATLMLLKGVPIITVSKILGHASVGFTLQTYGHVLPSMEKDAVKKMDELFAGMTG
jgi:integrase